MKRKRLNYLLLLQFFLMLLGFFSPIILKNTIGNENLSKLYSVLALSSLIDGSGNILVYKKIETKAIIIVQLLFLVPALILIESKLLVFFVFTRQLLQSDINYYHLSEEITSDRLLRVFLGIQIFLISIFVIFFNFNFLVIFLSILNILMTIFLKRKRRVIQSQSFKIKYLISSGSIAIICGGIFVSLIFKIIDNNHSLYLVLGLQIVNFHNNIYHFFKNSIKKNVTLSRIYNKILPDFAILLSLLCFLLVIFYPNYYSILLISIFVLMEIAITHFFVERQKRDNFNFIYRLIITIIFLFGIEFFEFPKILVLSVIIFVYYLISLLYGKYFVLDTRTNRL